jgi:hypothetical protein
VDLVGEHLAERPAEDREVLAEHEDLATLDRPPAGDDAVGVGPVLETGLQRAAGQRVELAERPRVEQQVDALTGQQLAPLVLAVAGLVGPRGERFLLALGQVRDALAHRVVDHGAKVLTALQARRIRPDR